MPLLKQFKTPYGIIRVTRAGDGSLIYYQNGSLHSQADKNGISRCAYIHILYEIILQSFARKILIIGCGGGTLATMLRRVKCDVTVIDINGAAFDIARDYFKLSREVKCVTQDGVIYLQNTKKRYNAVVIDVFGSKNTVPACFTADDFFHAVAKVLTPDGLMLMNMMTRDDKDKRAKKTARRAQTSFNSIRIFDWPGETDRNTLILGGADRQEFILPSGREPDEVAEDMEGLTCRLLRKPR